MSAHVKYMKIVVLIVFGRILYSSFCFCVEQIFLMHIWGYNIPSIMVDTSLPSPRRDGADLKLYSGERFQAIFSSENVTTHLKNFRHEIL